MHAFPKHLFTTNWRTSDIREFLWGHGYPCTGLLVNLHWVLEPQWISSFVRFVTMTSSATPVELLVASTATNARYLVIKLIINFLWSKTPLYEILDWNYLGFSYSLGPSMHRRKSWKWDFVQKSVFLLSSKSNGKVYACGLKIHWVPPTTTVQPFLYYFEIHCGCEYLRISDKNVSMLWN